MLWGQARIRVFYRWDSRPSTHPVFYSTHAQWQRSLLPPAWEEDTSVLCCTVLFSAWHSWEFHQSSTLKARVLHWSCFVSLQPPKQAKATLSSHQPYFPSLPQFSSFFPLSLQRLEGRSFTCCCQGGQLGSVQVKRKYRNSKGLWFKRRSSKKERSVLVFGSDRAQFSYFCREDYTHQGRAIPTWEFLYRYVFEEAASGINSTHYQGTDR